MNDGSWDVGCGFIKIKPRISSENLSVIHVQHCIFFKVNSIPVERNSVISCIISVASENDFFIYQPIDIELCVFRYFQAAVFCEINFRSLLYIKGFPFCESKLSEDVFSLVISPSCIGVYDIRVSIRFYEKLSILHYGKECHMLAASR